MDEQTRKQAIDNYLKLFDDIKARTSDERTALGILQEVNKDIRMAQIRAERNGDNSNGDAAPATVRQKNYLKRLGVKIPAGLTKQQASALIDEELEKESEQDSFPVECSSLEFEPQSIRIPWHSAFDTYRPTEPERAYIAF